MAKNAFKKEDKVEWETLGGKTRGTVKKKLTSPTKIKSHKVAATKENPEYLVETTESKKLAAHKPEALKKQTKKRDRVSNHTRVFSGLCSIRDVADNVAAKAEAVGYRNIYPS